MNKKIFEWIRAALIAVIIYAVVISFFSYGEVSGNSMYPTLHNGEHLIVQKHFIDYEVGDIVGFKFINAEGNKENHIKRVYALPGDKVEVKDNVVYVNDELALEAGIVDFKDATYNLADDEYFVIGDNSNDSYDSRMHGPVKNEDIIGKVIFTF